MSLARWIRLACGVAIAGLLATGCSPVGAGTERQEIRTIEVTIEHSLFVPETLDVQPGETVRFVVRNNDPIDHEFLIGDETVQQVHEEGTEAHHGARPGEISVPAAKTRSTTYTFGHAGYTLFGCHLPQHYDYGMKGLIVIS